MYNPQFFSYFEDDNLSKCLCTRYYQVEDLLYELSLQRLGGRAVSALREAPPVTSNGSGAEGGEDGAEGSGNGGGR